MRYGYARVSTKAQNIETQIDELKELGAEKVYQEKVSGANENRLQLNKLLDTLEQDDTFIVTRMDRVARTLSQGIDLIEQLTEKGVKIVVGNMGTFDNTPSSKMIRNILLAVAEWEREITLERQRAGIEQAKKQGKYKGRQTTYTEQNHSLKRALELFNNRDTNGMTVNEIAKATGVSRATIYRKNKEYNQEQGG